jgi:hypothetical protein
MADRFAGYMGGTGTDAEVARSEAARQRSPYASVVGDVAGSAALPGFGAESLAARYGSGALARAGAYGLVGGATGAAQGAGNTYSGNLPDYIKNAAIGGVLGTALGGVGGAAFGRVPGQVRGGAPDAANLFEVGDHGYKVLAQSGARYEPEAFRRVGDAAADKLYAERFARRDSPYAWRGVDEIRGQGAPSQPNLGYGAPIAPADIEWVRKGLNRVPLTPEAAGDRAASRIVKRGLDDFIVDPPHGSVLPGLEREAQFASNVAREARGNWAGGERVQALEDLIHNAQNTAGSTYSGLNTENELRKSIRSFTKKNEGRSQAELSGFNPEEVAALTDYTRRGSGFGSNALRWSSRVLGGGGGLGFGVLGGVSAQYLRDDPELSTAIGFGLPALGLAARKYGNARSLAAIEALKGKVAERTPLYQYRLQTGGLQPGFGQPNVAKTGRDAITLELLKQGRGLLPGAPQASEWE